MSFLARIKDFLKNLIRIRFKSKQTSNSNDNSCSEVTIEPYSQELDVNVEDNIEQFKMSNIIFEKLNYLEQYIKLFSLPFPKEYSHYLSLIQSQRNEYESELQEYYDGLLGEITFAIDPEHESSRMIALSKLESEIKDFVELVFNFSIYQDKFSKLCFKLNQFYNALLDTKRDLNVITSQLDNAIKTMHCLVTEVKELHFFKTDSRKKEIILNYLIYGEYIFLKSSLRCKLTSELDHYKKNLSKFHNMFIDSEYDSLVFKFFVEDLEHYQIYLTANLTQFAMCNDILKSCQSLQARLNDYQTVFLDPNFFDELIRFENTVDNISDNSGIVFTIPLPKALGYYAESERSTSVKEIACSVLNMLNCNKAKILYHVISNFKSDISWREFYFLCKIFELYQEVIDISCGTIFSYVSAKFASLATRYNEYSDNFIRYEKDKLLNYSGSKSKRYVFLLNSAPISLPVISKELKRLHLDFYVSGNDIYLNHSYFNGFKNLEENFGHYKLLEELL